MSHQSIPSTVQRGGPIDVQQAGCVMGEVGWLWLRPLFATGRSLLGNERKKCGRGGSSRNGYFSRFQVVWYHEPVAVS